MLNYIFEMGIKFLEFWDVVCMYNQTNFYLGDFFVVIYLVKISLNIYFNEKVNVSLRDKNSLLLFRFLVFIKLVVK